MFGGYFLFVYLTKPNPGPSRVPLALSPVLCPAPPGEALMGGW